MGIFPPQTDDRLVGTTDMGSFTADQNGSLGEKLEDIRANAGGVATVSGSGYQVVPFAGDGIDVVPGDNWTNGSFQEVTSGLPNAVRIFGVIFNHAVADTEAEIDIAIGGAGSEVVIATTSTGYGSTNKWFAQIFPFGLSVDAATRIAARGRRNATTGVIERLKLLYVEQSDLG